MHHLCALEQINFSTNTPLWTVSLLVSIGSSSCGQQFLHCVCNLAHYRSLRSFTQYSRRLGYVEGEILRMLLIENYVLLTFAVIIINFASYSRTHRISFIYQSRFVFESIFSLSNSKLIIEQHRVIASNVYEFHS